jgi:hypothetical protein
MAAANRLVARKEMKASRVQQALKILNASAEEFIVEGKPKARKSTVGKKPKKVTRKPQQAH